MNRHFRARHKSIQYALTVVLMSKFYVCSLRPQVETLSESRIHNRLIKQLLYKLFIYLYHIFSYLFFEAKRGKKQNAKNLFQSSLTFQSFLQTIILFNSFL